MRWYNQNGLIEANEKYSIFEDGLGCFLVDINAAELCDAGEWKCVITCKDGLIGITTNVVELDGKHAVPVANVLGESLC